MPYPILVVEDNRLIADTQGKLLRLLGYDVSVVYGGKEALASVGQKKYRVVLLDIDMPEIDGYEVAEKIRSDRRLSNIILIALTGHGEYEDVARAKAIGFNYHFTKPVATNDLKAVLDLYE